MRSCMFLILSVLCIVVVTATNNSNESDGSNVSNESNGSGEENVSSGAGEENVPDGSGEENVASNASNNSSGGSSNASEPEPEPEPEVVEAKVELSMSEAHATSVVDAFAAAGTKENVSMAMQKALAGAMTGVEAADIKITAIRIATRRLLAADGGVGFLRRLNSSNGSNESEPTVTDVKLVVEFEVTVPEGKTSAGIISLATGVDTAALTTSVETHLASEASLTVTVTAVSTPTAAVKTTASTSSNVASGAVPSTVSTVQLMLGLLAVLAVGA